MSSPTYRSTVWKPFRESVIVTVLCVVMPLVLISQTIGLLYSGPLG
ncbi:MAG: hypothetical protein ACREMK_12950 [Gemmatimonadota bacterium]